MQTFMRQVQAGTLANVPFLPMPEESSDSSSSNSNPDDRIARNANPDANFLDPYDH